MKRNLFYAITALAVTFAFASCENPLNPDEQNPDGGGNEPVEVTQDEVLFSNADNGDGFFYLDASAPESVNVVLIRPAGGSEASYNITSTSSEVLSVPESVSFAEGATQASIEIGVTGELEPMQKYDIELVLSGDNVAESASNLGSVRYEATIYTYEVTLMKSYFSQDYTASETDARFNYLGYFKSTFWLLPDNMILWKDFLGSGSDVRMTLSDTPVDGYRDVIGITLLGDLEMYKDEPYAEDWGGYFCYLGHYEDTTWCATKFYPKGEERYIDGIDLIFGTYTYSFAGLRESDNGYFYINADITFGDGSAYTYVILNMERVENWEEDGTDYVNYPEAPEVVIPDYPEPAWGEAEEGSMVILAYLYDRNLNEYTDIDDQVGQISTDEDGNPVLTIANFLNSGTTATFTQKSDNNIVIKIDGGYYYEYEGVDYYYDNSWHTPWANDSNWYVGYFCFDGTDGYCYGTISETLVEFTLWGWYSVYYQNISVKYNAWGCLGFSGPSPY